MTAIVGRGTAYLAATTWILKLIGLGSVFLILNRLTVHEYGITELVITVVPLLSIFLLPGLNATVIADMGIEKAQGNRAGVKGVLLNYIRLQSMFAVFIWAAVFFGASTLSIWLGKGDLAPLLRTVSFLFLLSPLRTMVQVLQRVYLRFFAQSVYTVMEEVSKLGFLLFFFFVFHMRAEGLILALVLSQAFSLACMLPAFVRIDRELWQIKAQFLPYWHFLLAHGK